MAGRPWKKGESGNPKGKPKGLTSLITSTRLKLALDAAVKREFPKYAKSDQPWADYFATLAIEAAKGGDFGLARDATKLVTKLDPPDQQAPVRVVIEWQQPQEKK